jgi:transcriptional regulator with XRE-family HTH domain
MRREMGMMYPALRRVPPVVRQRYVHAVACGACVAQARKARGWSQRELAARAGCSNQQISKVEAGAINTPIETLGRLAQALDVPLSCLAGPPSTPPEADLAQNEYYQLFKELCQRLAVPPAVWPLRASSGRAC